MFVKAGFVKEIGVMDENPFLYYEQLDWAIRGRRNGWEVGYCLDSHVYHKLGSSTKNSATKPSRQLFRAILLPLFNVLKYYLSKKLVYYFP